MLVALTAPAADAYFVLPSLLFPAPKAQAENLVEGSAETEKTEPEIHELWQSCRVDNNPPPPPRSATSTATTPSVQDSDAQTSPAATTSGSDHQHPPRTTTWPSSSLPSRNVARQEPSEHSSIYNITKPPSTPVNNEASRPRSVGLGPSEAQGSKAARRQQASSSSSIGVDSLEPTPRGLPKRQVTLDLDRGDMNG